MEKIFKEIKIKFLTTKFKVLQCIFFNFPLFDSMQECDNIYLGINDICFIPRYAKNTTYFLDHKTKNNPLL